MWREEIGKGEIVNQLVCYLPKTLKKLSIAFYLSLKKNNTVGFRSRVPEVIEVPIL